MVRLRKIPALLLNSAIVNHFLFQKGSMAVNHQCFWSGFREVSRSSHGFIVFIYASASENDLSSLKLNVQASIH